ncbi:hypothetical protein N7535_005605 [Penicillium sp. DV-2018c]|nr:hypothetical protein N7461_009179 [Penicillium sp. DV-2018c]KAJ5571945.1 hypothetical protein N7535_005605 [Penicillium sp. DV-2018c]
MHYSWLTPPAHLIPRCSDRPPPLKSCLIPLNEDLEALPSDEPFVRKTVHFPDDANLVQVRVIPPRYISPWARVNPFVKAEPVDKSLKTTSIKFAPYLPLQANVFPSRHQDDSKPLPRKARSARPIVWRPGNFAAAYANEPRSPRFEPSSEGSQAAPDTDWSCDTASFSGQLPVAVECGPLLETIPRGSSIEPAIDGSHAPAFNMSTLISALPESHAFDMSSLEHELPDLEASSTVFDLTALAEALPGLSVSPSTSPSTPVSQSSHVSLTPNPPAEAQHARVVVQAHVQVGPMAYPWLSILCWMLFVMTFIFPRLAPALLAILAFILIKGT